MKPHDLMLWRLQMTASVESPCPKILMIVEDQIILAMGLQCELEDGGYRVLELADHHQEALATARRVKPDLALVNIGLADGDDGVALARDLKTMGVPVLFISGQSDKAILAKAVGIASLPKPYSFVEMVSAVDYLFRHEVGDESLPAPPRLEMFDSDPPDQPSASGETLAEHMHHQNVQQYRRELKLAPNQLERAKLMTLIAREKTLGEDEGWSPTPDEAGVPI